MNEARNVRLTDLNGQRGDSSVSAFQRAQRVLPVKLEERLGENGITACLEVL